MARQGTRRSRPDREPPTALRSHRQTGTLASWPITLRVSDEAESSGSGVLARTPRGLAPSRHHVVYGGHDLAGDRIGVIERQERAAARHGGEAGARERLAELLSQLDAEIRVGVSPQDPHRAGELAEPAGRVEEHGRIDLPREPGEVVPDRLAGQWLYPVTGQLAVEASAEHAVGKRAVSHQL